MSFPPRNPSLLPLKQTNKRCMGNRVHILFFFPSPYRLSHPWGFHISPMAHESTLPRLLQVGPPAPSEKWMILRLMKVNCRWLLIVEDVSDLHY